MRLLVAFILVLFAVVGPGQGITLAQTPQPSPGGRPQPQQFAYKMTVSGPAAATSGQRVTYTVQYQQIGPDTMGLGFVLGWTLGAATYVSSSVTAGPSGTPIPDPSGSDVRWGFDGAGSGSTEIVLDVSPTFVGDLRVGFYVPGTNIVMSPGSVQDFVTHVTAAPVNARSLPNTGQGSTDGTPGAAKGALLLAGAVLLAGPAALRGCRSRVR